MGNGVRDVKSAISYLCSIFEMTVLGPVKFLLGIHIDRNRKEGWIRLSQTKYIEGVLHRYRMEDAKPVSTPLEHGCKLKKEMDETSKESIKDLQFLYQSALGSLMFAMVCTRPDIAHSVGALAKYTNCPTPAHWRCLKRVLRYLKGTLGMYLEYKKLGCKPILKGFSDASWGDDLDNSRSTSGYLFTLSGGAISWGSKQQKSVALSTTEAEIMASSLATQELIWSRSMLSELGFVQQTPTILMCDNTGAIALTKNPVHHPRTKHISIRRRFVEEKEEEKIVRLVYCPTEDMTADVLTKALSKEKHRKCVREMGLFLPPH
ncbi:hypothetical protein Mapa_014887 [Marchantia paleacea]|nr:hypothetical protein Mapa_014887 [Marchantia paleacea]